MEWGGFNSHGVCGASTVYDMQIDRAENPGSQRFEKQISGRYLGEIARLVICNLMQSGLLFAGEDVTPMTRDAAARVFGSNHSFTTPMMSAIEANQDAEIQRQLASKAGGKFAEYYSKASAAEQKTIRDVSVARDAMSHVIQLSVADSPASFAKWRSIDERGDRGENAAAAGVSCRRRRGDAGPWKEEEAEAEEEEEDAREGAPGRGLRGELGMFFLRSREIPLCNKSELNVKRQDAKIFVVLCQIITSC